MGALGQYADTPYNKLPPEEKARVDRNRALPRAPLINPTPAPARPVAQPYTGGRTYTPGEAQKAATPQAGPGAASSYRDQNSVFTDIANATPNRQYGAGTTPANTSPSATGRGGATGGLDYEVPMSGIVGVAGPREGKTLYMAGRNQQTGWGPNSRGVIGAPGDAAYALEQGRQANAARQKTIDADVADLKRKPNISVIGGRDGGADLTKRIARLANEASNAGSNSSRRSGLLREAGLLTDLVGEGNQRYGTDVAADTSVYNTDADNAATADYRAAGAEESRARAHQYLQGVAPQGKVFDAKALADLAPLLPVGPDGLPDQDSPIVQDYMQRMRDGYGMQRMQDGGLVQHYAEGGMVSALGRTTPTAPPHQSITAYQQYAAGAQAMGLPPVDFETFSGMSQGAPQVAGAAGADKTWGFASGGQIPDPSVAGKMVVDTNPQTNGDTIPAMVDGKQPAALKSGEFVFPSDVVLFYGTDKLNKMIEKVRQPKDGGSSTGASTALKSAAAAG